MPTTRLTGVQAAQTDGSCFAALARVVDYTRLVWLTEESELLGPQHTSNCDCTISSSSCQDTAETLHQGNKYNLQGQRMCRINAC